MESSLQKPTQIAAHFSHKAKSRVYWIATAVLCLQMSFTAYAQLAIPDVAKAFVHLGFPDYFRIELACAKLVGVLLLLAPVSARLKEWAYIGFAITLVSALVAHFAAGDGLDSWGWAAATSVLWALSYLSWRSLPTGSKFEAKRS